MAVREVNSAWGINYECGWLLVYMVIHISNHGHCRKQSAILKIVCCDSENNKPRGSTWAWEHFPCMCVHLHSGNLQYNIIYWTLRKNTTTCTPQSTKNNNDEEVRMLMEFVFWESSEEEDYTGHRRHCCHRRRHRRQHRRTIAHINDQSLVYTIFVSIT